MYIYMFRDEEHQVIYVGRTNNFKRRVQEEHFGGRGHLPEECYHSTKYVEVARVKSENESKIYEMYYIEKYTPKYNVQGTGGGLITFSMPELEWRLYQPRHVEMRKTKKEIEEELYEIKKGIKQESVYVNNFLRGKDRLEWIRELDGESQNEYLMIIYTMERYITAIEEIVDK